MEGQGRPVKKLAEELHASNEPHIRKILSVFDPDGQRVKDLKRLWGFAKGEGIASQEQVDDITATQIRKRCVPITYEESILSDFRSPVEGRFEGAFL